MTPSQGQSPDGTDERLSKANSMSMVMGGERSRSVVVSARGNISSTIARIQYPRVSEKRKKHKLVMLN